MAYVIGNSTQVSRFSNEFRDYLNSRNDVICMNWFPKYHELAGFKPSVWVWGDTYTDRHVNALKECWRYVRHLNIHKFISVTTNDTIPHNLRGFFGCSFYKRGHWEDLSQARAETLNEKLYHVGSTLTDCINLAAILFPGQSIYLYGCPYKGTLRHFYSNETLKSDTYAFELMWQGVSHLRRTGLDIIDCNDEGEKYESNDPR